VVEGKRERGEIGGNKDKKQGRKNSFSDPAFLSLVKATAKPLRKGDSLCRFGTK